jgi:hypothetical protein
MPEITADIEVKATRSFEHMGRRYTRGRIYQVNTDDPYVMGLIAGGYLIPTEVNDDQVDSAGADVVPVGGVDTDLPGRAKKRQRRQVDDGKGDMAHHGDHPDGSASDAAGGGPLHP